MPPNLGGFFMVRSYYPSECHADYFDFERIEALKPAIEACGISTLSQSTSLRIMFISSTFKRPVSSWKALNLRKTLLMASSVRLKPLNCSRLPCVYAQETLTFLLTQKKTCVKNYVQKE